MNGRFAALERAPNSNQKIRLVLGASRDLGRTRTHADRITAPVLLFHGTFDRNVGIEQSKHMAARLTAAGKPCKLVTWEGLDHQLEDSTVREQMLRTSDEFLRQALGITAMTATNAP